MFGPPPFMGGLSFRFITSVTAASSQITIPASVQAGDLLVLLDAAYLQQSGTVDDVTPSGFTQATTDIIEISLDRERQSISFRIAEEGDAEATVTGLNSTAELKILAVFRPNRKFTTASAAGWQNSKSGEAQPTGQTLPASSGTAPIIALAGYFALQGQAEPVVIDPRTFSVNGSDVKDGEDTEEATATNVEMESYLAWRICNSSAQLQDITVGMEEEGVRHILQSGYIQCSL